MPSDVIISVLVLVLGLLVGSFLNVCIYRIPIHKSIVFGRSYCPNCDSLIPWYLNIPIFSFLFLAGRCKQCRSKISLRYPIVELLTGIMFLVVWLIYGLTFQSLFFVIFFSILIVISLIDLDLQIIPDELIIVSLIIGVIHVIYQIFFLDSPWYLWVLGFIGASGILFIFGLILEDSIGGGDIKLMAAAGLFAGIKLILLSLFLAAIYAGILAVILVIRKKGGMKTAIPFGPFLSLGIVTSVLFGNQLIDWYLSLFL